MQALLENERQWNAWAHNCTSTMVPLPLAAFAVTDLAATPSTNNILLKFPMEKRIERSSFASFATFRIAQMPLATKLDAASKSLPSSRYAHGSSFPEIHVDEREQKRSMALHCQFAIAATVVYASGIATGRSLPLPAPTTSTTGYRNRPTRLRNLLERMERKA